jgi:hypothetical protein
MPVSTPSLVACSLAVALSGVASPALARDDSRWLTPTMIGARANMFDPNLNYLTFQHIDQMFATRSDEDAASADLGGA